MGDDARVEDMKVIMEVGICKGYLHTKNIGLKSGLFRFLHVNWWRIQKKTQSKMDRWGRWAWEE